MNETPLISIIVPVYNVEAYLCKCLDSIINQTYKNLEIILVDDGSTDNSGNICDIYADKDNRISVIHKENGGLSSARNSGIKQAKGQYIGFVDSDDFIELNMYEVLLGLCMKYQVPMSCVRFDTFGEKSEINYPAYDGKIEILSEYEFDRIVTLGLQSEKCFISTSVWDRLYQREVVNNLVFPEGKCYEDIVYTVQAIHNAQKCAYYGVPLYHYRIRKGSISNSGKKFDDRLLYDKWVLDKNRIKLLHKYGMEDLAALSMYNCYTELVHWKYLCSDKFAKRIINAEIDKIRRNTHYIIKNIRGSKNKLIATFKLVGKPLYYLLFVIYMKAQ